MPYAGSVETLSTEVPSLALPDNFPELLRRSVFAYQHTLPNGDPMWCPFVLNAAPCLPDFDALRRDGAGKATPEDFAIAADYAYEFIGGQTHTESTVAEEVRLRLVNGSLPEDRYNYTGIDCSGFTTTVLVRSLGACGIDLYDHLLVSPEDVEQAYQTPGWSPDASRRYDLLAQSISEEGLSVRAFTRAVHAKYWPIRGVDATKLAWNSSEVVEDGDIRSGDVGLYSPRGLNVFSHVAVVLGVTEDDHIEFAHSGRDDVRTERGGVEIFTLPRDAVLKQQHWHGHRGTMAIRRLNFLQAT